MTQRWVLAALLFCLLSVPKTFSATWYVNYLASGANNGKSWTNAYTSLQSAFDAAAAGDSIWVALGTYYPSKSADGVSTNGRDKAFVLKNNVHVFGGFKGTETTFADRKTDSSSLFLYNTTTLDGNIGNPNDSTDNTYHIVIAPALQDFTLDGFVIKNGRAVGTGSITANGRTIYRNAAGAIYSDSSKGTYRFLIVEKNLAKSSDASLGGGGAMYNYKSPVTVRYATFSGNTADNCNGGAILNYTSSVVVSNSAFINNECYTDDEGGGAVDNREQSNASFTDVVFNNNRTSGSGGAVYNDNSSPKFKNVTVSNNTAGGSGGGIDTDGGSDATFENVQFVKNSADEDGGGLFGWKSSVTLTNCTFVSNNAGGNGGGMYNYNTCNPVMRDVIFKSNTAVTDYGGFGLERNSTAVLTNALFFGNEAGNNGGGAGCHDNHGSNATMVLTNVTIAKNKAKNGSGYYDQGSTSQLRNTIVAENGTDDLNVSADVLAKVRYILRSVGTTLYLIDNGNTSPNGTKVTGQLFTSATDSDFTLITGSPAINAGDSSFYKATQTPNISAVTRDLRNAKRVMGTNIDIGAYEFCSETITPKATLKVSPDTVVAKNTTITYTLTASNVGDNPRIEWRKNGVIIPGETGLEYTANAGTDVNNSDTVYAMVYSAEPCAVPQSLATNKIKMYVAAAWFVNHAAKGKNNGRSWSDAFTNLQSALDVARSGDAIWVAKGTYYPTAVPEGITPSDREKTFFLKDSIMLFGGFQGTEASLTARLSDSLALHVTNQTILSGDVGTRNQSSDNAYHVVMAVSAKDFTVNGFTINGGNANKDLSSTINTLTVRHNSGAGIYAAQSRGTFSNLIVETNTAESGSVGTAGGAGMYSDGATISMMNMAFKSNDARNGHGGAVLCSGNSTLTLHDALFSGNTAKGSGGAMYQHSGISSIVQAVFTDNTAATSGGAIYGTSEAQMRVTNSVFNRNTAGNSFGAIGLAQGANAVITGILATRNSASVNGGGIGCADDDSGSDMVVTNATIIQNSAKTGGGIYDDGTSTKIRNSIIVGNSPADAKLTPEVLRLGRCNILGLPIGIRYVANGSTQPDGTPVAGPFFVDSARRDYRPSAASESINAGDSLLYAAGATPDISGTTTDVAGKDRIIGKNIDVGAFEHSCTQPAQFKASIAAAPDSRVTVNSTVTFTLYLDNAGGNPAVQWLKNNSPIPGASGTSYQAVAGMDFSANDVFSAKVTSSAACVTPTAITTNTVKMYLVSAWFVNEAATGNNNGTSWENAFTKLQDALATAKSGDTIWVARGTYKPTAAAGQSTDVRDNTFLIKNGIHIFGGFAGAEAAFSSRQTDSASLFDTNKTVLDGDLGIIGNTSDNSYHVVSIVGATNFTLDGFTVTNGNANGESPATILGQDVPRSGGGGIVSLNSSGYLRNLSIGGNSCSSGGSTGGGGVYSGGSSLRFTSCYFTRNSSAGNGGAVCNAHGSSSVFSRTVFSHNSATGSGGGIFNTDGGKASVESSLFINNNAASGGGVGAEGGFELLITSSLFYGNTATGSGGAIGAGSTASGNTIITNTTIAGNTAANGGGIYGGSTTVKLRNSVVVNNVPTNLADSSTILKNTNHSVIGSSGRYSAFAAESPSPAGTPIHGPLFVEEDKNNYRLASSSQLINSGDNTVFDVGKVPDLSGALLDVTGAARISGSSVDIGAFEHWCTDSVLVTASISVTPSTTVALNTEVTFQVKSENLGAEPYIEWLKNGITVSDGNKKTYKAVFGVDFTETDTISARVFSSEECGYPAELHTNGIAVTVRTSSVHHGSTTAGRYSIYPNPNRGTFTISCMGLPDISQEIIIRDITGRLVFRTKGSGSSTTVVAPHTPLAPGLYSVAIQRTDSDLEMLIMAVTQE